MDMQDRECSTATLETGIGARILLFHPFCGVAVHVRYLLPVAGAPQNDRGGGRRQAPLEVQADASYFSPTSVVAWPRP